VANVPETTFTFRPLTAAETNAELGAAQVWLHESVAARLSLDDAIKHDSKSGLALEAMGFLKFHEGKDQEALTYFERALQDGFHAISFRILPGDAFRPIQCAATSCCFESSHRAESGFRSRLRSARCQLYREGRLESAVPIAIKAHNSGHRRRGYHLLIGSILHRSRPRQRNSGYRSIRSGALAGHQPRSSCGSLAEAAVRCASRCGF
jgi:hypothetical protein